MAEQQPEYVRNVLDNEHLPGVLKLINSQNPHYTQLPRLRVGKKTLLSIFGLSNGDFLLRGLEDSGLVIRSYKNGSGGYVYLTENGTQLSKMHPEEISYPADRQGQQLMSWAA